MTTVYLEIFEWVSDKSIYNVPIETVIVLFTMKYCESELKIKFIQTDRTSGECHMIDGNYFDYDIIDKNNLPSNVSNCQLPNISIDNSNCITGLCACLRKIIKLSKYSTELLGFKHSCLLSCSESSIWTKYCEVDLISTLNTRNRERSEVPIDLVRFEMHMANPVPLHNVYKYYSEIPEHLYAEGPTMTLADIIIFVCIFVFLDSCWTEELFELLPLTGQWYKRMMSQDFFYNCTNFIKQFKTKITTGCFLSVPTVPNQSLYRRNAENTKLRNQFYTRQANIENSLEIIRNMELKLNLINKPWDNKLNFDWSEIPYDATPEGGSSPVQRSTKKRQQLESLCKPILKLAKNGDVIVDFCSGSGHLGILIAFLLPECTVILLENKEESLKRSMERVKKLKINNIKFYQCNIDYFIGNFDIGTSLHACGVATDLVIRQCISQNAFFVCCPCCYGSVKDCHHITYPRSDIYKEKVVTTDYLVLSHAADQTHSSTNVKTSQGYECMNIIDTDRKLHAEQFGYEVHLTKLTPESCTPKNNLLIGIPTKQENFQKINVN